MKFLLMLSFLLLSCGNKKTKVVVPKNSHEPIIVKDTIFVPIFNNCDEQIKSLENDVKFWIDSVNYKNNTIQSDVYFNARKIQKIKYYIAITEKNPNNKRFFYGWIRRTMSEN